jgi:hypothetical protein
VKRQHPPSSIFLSREQRSPSFTIRNPFASPGSTSGSSIHSFQTSSSYLAPPALRLSIPSSGQEAPPSSGISTPPSALIASFRQPTLWLESPHYSDSSQSSRSSALIDFEAPIIPNTLSIITDPRRPSVATEIQRISIFSDRAPAESLDNTGERRGLFNLGRKPTLSKPASPLTQPRLARKYSLGLK